MARTHFKADCSTLKMHMLDHSAIIVKLANNKSKVHHSFLLRVYSLTFSRMARKEVMKLWDWTKASPNITAEAASTKICSK